MSRDIFDDPGDLSLEDIARLNQDGYVDDPSLADSPVVFEDQFELRSRELQASPPKMQTVSVFPVKPGPWSGNNQLGIHQRFAPDANNRQTILKMDEWGMPEMWTLCLGLDFDHNNWAVGGVSSAANFDMTALINFGVGGVVQQVEVDWVNGAAISLPMNAINVIAQYNLNTEQGEGGAASEPPLDLVLRASVARGSLFHCYPTRTYFLNANFTPFVDPTPTVDIPPFAKSVKIVAVGRNDQASDTFLAYSLPNAVLLFNTGVAANGGGAVIQTHSFSQLVEYLDIPNVAVGAPVAIDIPTGARSLSLILDTIVDANIYNYRVVFQIGV